MKNMTVPVAVAVAIVGCVLAVSANVTTTQMTQNIDKERYKRLAAERELQMVQGDIRQLNAELIDSRNKLQQIQTILDKGQADLKAQLDAARLEKDKMMQELQQLKTAPQAVIPQVIIPSGN